jgi:hypothetical protein
MPDAMRSTPVADAVDASVRRDDWACALRVLDDQVGLHLERAGMSAEDIGLRVTVAEDPERPGHPALRVTTGDGDGYTVDYLDWRGRPAWGRPRRRIGRDATRAIARRRWILAMEKEGATPEDVPLHERSVDPLLARWISDGRLTLDALAPSGRRPPGGRYRIGSMPWMRSSHVGRIALGVEVPGLPAMDVHVDHGEVRLYAMSLSRDVTLVQRPDQRPGVLLGRHRLPASALASLPGRPLRDLVDSPHLDPDAMPVVGSVLARANGAAGIRLRSRDDGMLVLHRSPHARP